MAYHYSPFECTWQDNAQRVTECSHLAVIGGPKFPAKSEYSDDFRKLIVWQLEVDPMKRPTVHQVIAKVQQMIAAK